MEFEYNIEKNYILYLSMLLYIIVVPASATVNTYCDMESIIGLQNVSCTNGYVMYNMSTSQSAQFPNGGIIDGTHYMTASVSSAKYTLNLLTEIKHYQWDFAATTDWVSGAWRMFDSGSNSYAAASFDYMYNSTHHRIYGQSGGSYTITGLDVRFSNGYDWYHVTVDRNNDTWYIIRIYSPTGVFLAQDDFSIGSSSYVKNNITLFNGVAYTYQFDNLFISDTANDNIISVSFYPNPCGNCSNLFVNYSFATQNSDQWIYVYRQQYINNSWSGIFHEVIQSRNLGISGVYDISSDFNTTIAGNTYRYTAKIYSSTTNFLARNSLDADSVIYNASNNHTIPVPLPTPYPTPNETYIPNATYTPYPDTNYTNYTGYNGTLNMTGNIGNISNASLTYINNGTIQISNQISAYNYSKSKSILSYFLPSIFNIIPVEMWGVIILGWALEISLILLRR